MHKVSRILEAHRHLSVEFDPDAYSAPNRFRARPRSCCRWNLSGSNAAQLFRAGEVHLDGSKEVDLVVIGVGWMSGADNGWFWVVHSALRNPDVVLFAGGNSLELMASRTRGYRGILSLFSTASETRNSVYHFDGKQYKLWKEECEPDSA